MSFKIFGFHCSVFAIFDLEYSVVSVGRLLPTIEDCVSAIVKCHNIPRRMPQQVFEYAATV